MGVASLIKRICFHPTILDYTQIIPPGVGDRFSYRQDRLSGYLRMLVGFNYFEPRGELVRAGRVAPSLEDCGDIMGLGDDGQWYPVKDGPPPRRLLHGPLLESRCFCSCVHGEYQCCYTALPDGDFCEECQKTRDCPTAERFRIAPLPRSAKGWHRNGGLRVRL